MEELLKRELNMTKVKNLGSGEGGQICQGFSFETDQGKVFVKIYQRLEARLMFDGEYASLVALSVAGDIRVPKPIKVFDIPDGGAAFVMEYLDLSRSLSKYSAQLGEQLARLHLKNSDVEKQIKKSESSVHKIHDLKYVDKFGFDVVTCCGYIPQDNSWTEDWVQYYARKMEIQMALIDKDYGDRELRDLWSQLLPKLPKFFEGLDIKPALLHGDFHAGNIAENEQEPVVFDPACFYGHSEFDLSMVKTFGGLASSFFNSYFHVIPKAPGYDSRFELYRLFHYVNHWNHFGTKYKGLTIDQLRSLVKKSKVW